MHVVKTVPNQTLGMTHQFYAETVVFKGLCIEEQVVEFPKLISNKLEYERLGI